MYKIDGGSCLQWNNNSTKNVDSDESMTIYEEGGSCGTLACTKSYSDLRAVDSDDDCSVKITDVTPCVLGDQ